MHLSIGKCMFGRQMEMDKIMYFLMQKDHPSTESVGVLPIVGPAGVGKSTLVAHVLNDERVRNHFTQILVVNGDDTEDENLAILKDTAMTLQQNSTFGENQRLLAIIDCSWNFDEVAWNSWFLSSARCLPRALKANVQRNLYLFGEDPHELLQKNKPASYVLNNDEFLVCGQYPACLAEDNIPAITMYDVVSGSVKCEGEFEVLIWKSHIRPYEYYIRS
ncbi:hypothetical protein BAE44_0008941 [Dichanthelium oligosanthes]|uniref:NB-ARC domain-containing protein n=1 Tax=Dichanthelium oligosanthes TaxID=888268 RepID=A0A1E5VY54_9POAL|nr:hypothetical protein BAE44_0008941 [Dichanthelium oligosanthes]